MSEDRVSSKDKSRNVTLLFVFDGCSPALVALRMLQDGKTVIALEKCGTSGYLTSHHMHLLHHYLPLTLLPSIRIYIDIQHIPQPYLAPYDFITQPSQSRIGPSTLCFHGLKLRYISREKLPHCYTYFKSITDGFSDFEPEFAEPGFVMAIYLAASRRLPHL